ncbi:DUF5719 family protein [Nesterenkonia halotolerans]|uniref:Uncharacterized protein n=2 Tax=Nesterenkonia halotolerans TaxID=225325 RepID=A0ABR9JAX0_9MICC|nr:DUF5719 family protein [Nesterenkonia halotolerans]MBE1515711.1 hypothetical protein [Nesterenkonia halotolerans]
MSAKKVKVKKLIKEQRRARERAIREQERAATQKAKQDAAAARAELRAEEKRLREEQESQLRAEKQSAAEVRKESDARKASEARREAETRKSSPAAPSEHAAPTTKGAASAPAASATVSAAATAAAPKNRGSRRDRRSRAGRAQGDAATSAARRSGAGTRTAAVVVTAGVLAAMVGSVVLDGLVDGRSEAAAGSSGVDQGAAAALGAASVAAPRTGQSFICPPMPGQPDSLTTEGELEYRERDASATSRFSAVLFATDLSGSFPAAEWSQLNEESRVNDVTLTEASGAQQAESGGAAPSDPLSQREAVYESSTDPVRPPLLSVEAATNGSPLAAAGLYEYQADAGSVAGLAVGQCTAPERSQWFFGPEIAAGASSLLTLANPFDRSATVEVTSVDSEGDRGTSGARSVVVPGQTTRSVNIAGLASAGTDLGVSVRSSGAPVTAQLQSSRASGVTGTGIEFLPGLTDAGTSHVLPGITVPEGITETDAEDDADETDESAEDDEQTGPTPPELWIHVPGDQGATVEVQVYGEDGQQSLDIPGVFTVDGGEVDAIELQGLQPGVTDIRVRTDVPAYAAVRSESDQGSDFSWAAPTEALAEGSGALLPELGESELRFFGSGASGSIGYRVMDAEGEFGEEQTVEVPADGGAVLSAEDIAEVEPEGSEAGAAVVVFSAPELTGEGGIHAMLATTAGEDQISLSPVEQLRGAEQYVPVRLLR